MEYSLGIAVLESILSPDGHDRQREFWRALIEAKGRYVNEWNMGVEPLEVRGDISCQGMSRWEGEIRDDVAKVFQRRREPEALVLGDIEPGRLGGLRWF